jgi:hypothetical protein
MWLIQVASSMQMDVEAHMPIYPNIPSKFMILTGRGKQSSSFYILSLFA